MVAILAGLGGWLPPKVVTNSELCENLDTTDEWIQTRTGIHERRMVSEGLSTRDLAVEAGERALKSAGGLTADTVVVATTSPDRLCPAVAPEVASRLGLGTVAAFDLTSACSGFLYGLATSAGLIAAGVADTVLFVAAEAFTTLVNPRDRATAPIFGDGAGAVVLRRGDAGEPGALGAFELGSDGARADLLAIPAGGSRQRSATGLGHDAVPAGDWYLQMEGRLLYRHAVERMTESARAVLAKEGWTVDDVDSFVGHQANIRIVQAVAEELGLPDERVAVNIDRTGNTLAASIPILLGELAARGDLKAGQRVLLNAFGAGLSWGATALTWPELTVEEIH
jgi:3-oxoacyl-[acyl-carrier-protein] synthase III